MPGQSHQARPAGGRRGRVGRLRGGDGEFVRVGEHGERGLGKEAQVRDVVELLEHRTDGFGVVADGRDQGGPGGGVVLADEGGGPVGVAVAGQDEPGGGAGGEALVLGVEQAQGFRELLSLQSAVQDPQGGAG